MQTPDSFLFMPLRQVHAYTYYIYIRILKETISILHTLNITLEYGSKDWIEYSEYRE